MNKKRICDIVMPNVLARCDWRQYTEAQKSTFRRFIMAMPDGLMNPHIYHPEEGIGIQFGRRFNSAPLTIDENRIYVEKLDNDHDAWIRDEWFDFPEGAAIPEVITKFLVQFFTIDEKYFEEFRRDYRLKKQSRIEFDAYMSKFANESPEFRMAKILGYPLRRPMLYEASHRRLAVIEKL